MKKYFVFIILFIAGLLFIPIPGYRELNNIAIIEEIDFFCDKSSYSVSLKEIVPTRNNLGIKYHYKKHNKSFKNLKSVYRFRDINNKYFYSDVKKLVTNCDSTVDILSIFEIQPRVIEHKKKNTN